VIDGEVNKLSCRWCGLARKCVCPDSFQGDKMVNKNGSSVPRLHRVKTKLDNSCHMHKNKKVSSWAKLGKLEKVDIALANFSQKTLDEIERVKHESKS